MEASADRVLNSDIADIGEYLSDSYRAVVEVDELIHVWRDRLRTRLYAFRLATDSRFLEAIEEAEKNIESGEARKDAFTAADL